MVDGVESGADRAASEGGVPDVESVRVSHEAIYQSLFIEGRGALKRELVTCLRTGRALREPRARSRNKAQGHLTADVILTASVGTVGDSYNCGLAQGINGLYTRPR